MKRTTTWEDRTRWEITKREQYLKERRAGMHFPRFLIFAGILPSQPIAGKRARPVGGDRPGELVEDSYGKKYVLAPNRDGRAGGLRKLSAEQATSLEEAVRKQSAR